MSGTRAALLRDTLLQEHLPQTRDHIRHQVGLLGLGREQNEVGETFDHHRRKLPQVGLAALEALLHELVNVTVQAVRHLAPLSLSPSNIDSEQQSARNRPRWCSSRVRSWRSTFSATAWALLRHGWLPVPRLLGALQEIADPTHLLYGSDWPFT